MGMEISSSSHFECVLFVGQVRKRFFLNIHMQMVTFFCRGKGSKMILKLYWYLDIQLFVMFVTILLFGCYLSLP
jgi:hypothetical protein